jgi:hypothetical protein
MEAVAEDNASNAQYYAIANINESHYINLNVKKLTPSSATEAGVSSSTRKKQKKGAATGPGKKEFQHMKFDGKNYYGKYGRSSRWGWLLDPTSIHKEEKQLCKKKSSWGQWKLLQPGNSSGIVNSPPDECANVPIQYQAFEKSCLASSFASALHMAGHETAARNLQEKISLLVQENDQLLCRFVNMVDNSKLRDSEGRLLHMSRDSNYDILTGPSPASVTLQGQDGGTGHAIAIFENYIFDASWPQALPRTMESLDWCCSPSTFFQPFRVYVLKIRAP